MKSSDIVYVKGFAPMTKDEFQKEVLPYEYVYCTRCKHFRLDNEEIPYCPFEDECDINDCEDSSPFIERPHYFPNNI